MVQLSSQTRAHFVFKTTLVTVFELVSELFNYIFVLLHFNYDFIKMELGFFLKESSSACNGDWAARIRGLVLVAGLRQMQLQLWPNLEAGKTFCHVLVFMSGQWLHLDFLE